MKQFITQEEWLKLTSELRIKLISNFAINKSNGTIVTDGKLTSDGCSKEDLMSLNIGSMIEYLKNDWDKVDNDVLFDTLLKRVIATITDEFTIKATLTINEETKTNSPIEGRINKAGKPKGTGKVSKGESKVDISTSIETK